MSRIARSKHSFTNLVVLALAGSIFIAPTAYAKHASFEMPVCEKLLDGNGPDPAKQSNRAPNGSSSKDLTPMKLTDDKDSFSLGADGKVKIEVQESNELQGAGAKIEDPTAAASVVGNDEKLKHKLLKDSQKVNVAPIA